MSSSDKNLLFLLECDTPGPDAALLQLAEALARRGERVQVGVKRKSRESAVVTQLLPTGEIVDEMLAQLHFRPHLVVVGSSPGPWSSEEVENLAQATRARLCRTRWVWQKDQWTSDFCEGDLELCLPGAVDLAIFRSSHRPSAKRALGLDQDRFHLVVASDQAPKGGTDSPPLTRALQNLWERLSPYEREKVEILELTGLESRAPDCGTLFARWRFARVEDERLLSVLLQAGDAYLDASPEDPAPSLLLQALACGTPAISWDTTQRCEFVVDRVSGLAVKEGDFAAVAEALACLIASPPETREAMGSQGRDLVREKGSLEGALKIFERLWVLPDPPLEPYSVALCTCNGEDYLAEQIESILAQHVRPAEIVVCDDASTDRTWEILRFYQNREPGLFRLCRNEPRLGVVKNFERAINLCSHEIVFLSDQDDVWYPHKSQAVLAVFRSNPSVRAVSHNLQLCSADRSLLKPTMWDTMAFRHFLQKEIPNKDYLFHAIFFGNMVTGASFCLKKPQSPLTLSNEFATVIHDYQLALDYLATDSLCFYNHCLGLYRQHEKQQIGAALEYIEQFAAAIDVYYQAENSAWIFLYLSGRRRHDSVFSYIDTHPNPKFRWVVQDAVRASWSKVLRPKNWWSFLRVVLSRLKAKVLRRARKVLKSCWKRVDLC